MISIVSMPFTNNTFIEKKALQVMTYETANSHIIGFGGVFFKSKNPGHLLNWYKEHLGFSTQTPYMEGDDAITFKWHNWDGIPENTVWAPFPTDTTYFEPSEKEFMINYIVRDLKGLLEKLKAKGIMPIGNVATHSFGKFAQILDPEGTKIEFWEPDRDHFADKY